MDVKGPSTTFISKLNFKIVVHQMITMSWLATLYFSLLPQRRIWWGTNTMSMETLSGWETKKCKGHACIHSKYNMHWDEEKNNRKKTQQGRNMYINTTVTPVSFFSQSGILVTDSNHKHRQDNHIPSGEDRWFEVQFTIEWTKKEGIVPASIYPSPTPPF